jgi:hypothetical protein
MKKSKNSSRLASTLLTLACSFVFAWNALADLTIDGNLTVQTNQNVKGVLGVGTSGFPGSKLEIQGNSTTNPVMKIIRGNGSLNVPQLEFLGAPGYREAWVDGYNGLRFNKLVLGTIALPNTYFSDWPGAPLNVVHIGGSAVADLKSDHAEDRAMIALRSKTSHIFYVGVAPYGYSIWNAYGDSAAPMMTVEQNVLGYKGRVGINSGTNAPGAQFQVKSFDASTITALFQAAPTQTADILQLRDSGNNVLSVVASNGSWGIGINSPSERLHVSGNIKVSNGQFIGNGSGLLISPQGDLSMGAFTSGQQP